MEVSEASSVKAAWRKESVSDGVLMGGTISRILDTVKHKKLRYSTKSKLYRPAPGALKWGIPQLGAKDFKTGWFENSEIVPDVVVRNDPASIAAGKDPQLEAVVTKLLETLGKP